MFDPTTFTGIHTWLSIVAIVFGVITVWGLFSSRTFPICSGVFTVAAVLTSATGYGFHRAHILPSHIVGAIALIVLALMIAARYAVHFMGAWRWVYAATATASLYFLVFVAVAQAFQKAPALTALPGAAFGAVQLLVLIGFIAIGLMASKRFRPPAPIPAGAQPAVL